MSDTKIPEEPSCITRIRAANKRDKILDEHLQYTDSLRARCEGLVEELYLMTQSNRCHAEDSLKHLQRADQLQRECNTVAKQYMELNDFHHEVCGERDQPQRDLDLLGTVVRTGYPPPEGLIHDEIAAKSAARAVELHTNLRTTQVALHEAGADEEKLRRDLDLMRAAVKDADGPFWIDDPSRSKENWREQHAEAVERARK